MSFNRRILVYAPAKTVPEMTYNVFSGTLNPTHFTYSLTLVYAAAGSTVLIIIVITLASGPIHLRAKIFF